MKILALFIVVVIISLSSFSGTMVTVQPIAKKASCTKSAGMLGCKHHKKQSATNDCGSTCALIFSCGMCGFLAIEPVQVKARTFYQIEKPVTHYKIGNLSEYHPTGWQPPEVYS
jgi:hypothetical protein